MLLASPLQLVTVKKQDSSRVANMLSRSRVLLAATTTPCLPDTTRAGATAAGNATSEIGNMTVTVILREGDEIVARGVLRGVLGTGLVLVRSVMLVFAIFGLTHTISGAQR